MFTNGITFIIIIILLVCVFATYALQRLPYFLANTLKRPRQAIALYTWMIRLDMMPGSSYLNRGQARLLVKEYELALQDIERGLGLRPQSAVGYANRGSAYLCLKQ